MDFSQQNYPLNTIPAAKWSGIPSPQQSGVGYHPRSKAEWDTIPAAKRSGIPSPKRNGAERDILPVLAYHPYYTVIANEAQRSVAISSQEGMFPSCCLRVASPK